jgi:hypothetical protein
VYTSQKVRRVLQDMSDDEFDVLLDELSPEARQVVDGASGRSGQADALTRYHEEEGRSLRTLVEMIREVVPSLRF